MLVFHLFPFLGRRLQFFLHDLLFHRYRVDHALQPFFFLYQVFESAIEGFKLFHQILKLRGIIFRQKQDFAFVDGYDRTTRFPEDYYLMQMLKFRSFARPEEMENVRLSYE